MIKLVLVGDVLKFGLVILLLFSVIAVFVSPAVDLEPTALRAAKMANLLFALLALAGTAFTARLRQATAAHATTFEPNYGLLSAPDLVNLNCIRLC